MAQFWNLMNLSRIREWKDEIRARHTTQNMDDSFSQGTKSAKLQCLTAV